VSSPLRGTCTPCLLLLLCCTAAAAESPAAARLAADARAARPLVAHVVVALCDNVHQGIVKVPKALGDGQTPRTNLYWGARYGLKTFLGRDGGWTPVAHEGAAPKGVLERIVLTRRVSKAAAYVVADAWDGRQIRRTVERFLHMAAGRHPETLRIRQGDATLAIPAGGAAHLVAYVGHNGLMDFAAPAVPEPASQASPRAAVVLACKSTPYFGPLLARAHAEPLVLTTGFMAPEAYTLDAILKAWLAGATPQAARDAAARAYHRYQKCGLRGARRLFGLQP